MKVIVNFMGPLGIFIGQKKVEFQLDDGATYGDLLREIGRRFGDMLPEKVWDRERNAFKGRLLVIGAGRDLQEPDTPLLDNEDIKFLPMIAGG
ncbi:MAG: MoaD/ThiS family protein [Thermodesulfobacteriota bacterium]